eukprot:COSAG01_NODE_5887_length_3969_cov_4.471576_1_plen_297_part_00
MLATLALRVVTVASAAGRTTVAILALAALALRVLAAAAPAVCRGGRPVGVQVWDAAVPRELLHRVRVEATSVFAPPTTAAAAAASAHGRTHSLWVPVPVPSMVSDGTSHAGGAFALEELVHMLHGLVGFGNHDGACEVVGAEVWAQFRSRAAGMSAHWDRDEVSFQHNGTTHHPLVSTVTYLDGHGGPTLVLNLTVREAAAAAAAAAATNAHSAVAVWPKARRHLAFPGALPAFAPGCPALYIRETQSRAACCRGVATSRRRAAPTAYWRQHARGGKGEGKGHSVDQLVGQSTETA